MEDEESHVVTATIKNQKGLHARAAAKFVKLAERFAATISVVRCPTVRLMRSSSVPSSVP